MATDWEAAVRQATRLEPIGNGYVVPSPFKLTASIHSGRPGDPDARVDAQLEIICEVVDEQVWTRRVAVSTDDSNGVTSTMLRSVKIRDAIVKDGLSGILHRVELDGMSAKVTPVGPDDDDESTRTAIERAVRYVGVGGGVAKPATVAGTSTIPDVTVKTEDR